MRLKSNVPALAASAAATAVLMGIGIGLVVGQTAFNDVPDSDPRREDIDYAAAQGWFQGYPDGSFQPDRQITEDQLARVIRRARPGLTRGDAAVFLRGGIGRLEATVTAATTVTAAATTTTVRTGGPSGEGPAAPDGEGPVDPNPPAVIEPTTTTTEPAAAATTTTVRTGGPGGEGPVDPNPPAVIEPTTTTTAPSEPATTTTNPADAGPTLVYGRGESGWTAKNGAKGSMVWWEFRNWGSAEQWASLTTSWGSNMSVGYPRTVGTPGPYMFVIDEFQEGFYVGCTMFILLPLHPCSIDGPDPAETITAFRITGARCDIACTTTESSSMPAAVWKQVTADGFTKSDG